jgi:NAD(P)-dependent dehydrogenase (short-subunit alcohol dehydrogenase family)
MEDVPQPIRSPKRFAGDIAVVTGAGRGMGRIVAQRLAAEGAHVVVAELDPNSAETVTDEITTAGGLALSVPTDVSDVSQIGRLFAEVGERFGRCDILINNAGIGVPRPLLDYTEVEWDRQFAVNLRGLFFCTQAAARMMVPARRGKIVNFASTAAFVSSSQLAEVAYDVSKGGVRQLTISAAYELAPHGINVNAVAPGQILTEMTRKGMEDPARKQRALAKIPIGRLGTPEDVANAVLFLCSDAADYVVGHVLVVDGGWLLP